MRTDMPKFGPHGGARQPHVPRAVATGSVDRSLRRPPPTSRATAAAVRPAASAVGSARSRGDRLLAGIRCHGRCRSAAGVFLRRRPEPPRVVISPSGSRVLPTAPHESTGCGSRGSCRVALDQHRAATARQFTDADTAKHRSAAPIWMKCGASRSASIARISLPATPAASTIGVSPVSWLWPSATLTAGAALSLRIDRDPGFGGVRQNISLPAMLPGRLVALGLLVHLGGSPRLPAALAACSRACCPGLVPAGGGAEDICAPARVRPVRTVPAAASRRDAAAAGRSRHAERRPGCDGEFVGRIVDEAQGAAITCRCCSRQPPRCRRPVRESSRPSVRGRHQPALLAGDRRLQECHGVELALRARGSRPSITSAATPQTMAASATLNTHRTSHPDGRG